MDNATTESHYSNLMLSNGCWTMGNNSEGLPVCQCKENGPLSTESCMPNGPENCWTMGLDSQEKTQCQCTENGPISSAFCPVLDTCWSMGNNSEDLPVCQCKENGPLSTESCMPYGPGNCWTMGLDSQGHTQCQCQENGPVSPVFCPSPPAEGSACSADQLGQKKSNLICLQNSRFPSDTTWHSLVVCQPNECLMTYSYLRYYSLASRPTCNSQDSHVFSCMNSGGLWTSRNSLRICENGSWYEAEYENGIVAGDFVCNSRG